MSARSPSGTRSVLRVRTDLDVPGVVLLLRRWGALADELQLQQPRGPRATGWLTTFGQFSKYKEKLFNSSLKSKDTKKSKDVKNPKKTTNSTKIPRLNATNRPPQDPMNPPPGEHHETRNSGHRPPPRAPGSQLKSPSSVPFIC